MATIFYENTLGEMQDQGPMSASGARRGPALGDVDLAAVVRNAGPRTRIAAARTDYGAAAMPSTEWRHAAHP